MTYDGDGDDSRTYYELDESVDVDGACSTSTFAYDADGNTTPSVGGTAITTYVYDSHDQHIESIDADGKTMSYGYDLGDRVKLTIQEDTVSNTTIPAHNADSNTALMVIGSCNDAVATRYAYDPDDYDTVTVNDTSMPTANPTPIEWETLLAAFAGKRILVVGDVMLDDYLWGDVRRICPEAPVPIVETRKRTSRPGGAGNSAANIASLGATAILVGVVGMDAAAEQIRTALREAAVDPDGLLTADDRPTTAKTRVIAHQQQVLRIDTEQTHPIPKLLADRLFDRVDQLIPQVDAVLMCDYAKGVFSAETAARVIQAARKARLPVVVDPKGKDYQRYRGATVMKPNIHELELLGRKAIQSPSDLHATGQQLTAELAGTAVLVTQGSEGMTLFRPDAAHWHQPAAVPRAVYDVTGAGDTVVSVLALTLACRAPLTQAIQLANISASIVVSKLGTSTVSLAELRAGLEDFEPNDYGSDH